MTDPGDRRPADTTGSSGRAAPGSHARRLLALLSRHRLLGAAAIASLGAALYWGLIASDRYVSQAHVIIQRTDLAGSQAGALDFGSLLGGSSNRPDQMLLRDYLLSTDMLRKLDAKLGLRAHYSSPARDPLSRLWFQSDEWFHRHYLARTRVEYDDYAGVLLIDAEGYEPQVAHAIASMLVDEGGRFMNEMVRSMAQEQVGFLELQVERMRERTMRARRAVLAFQNKHGLLSPQATAESMAAVINQLEAKRTDLQTRRNALLGYLSPSAPAVIDVDLQIDAVEKQLARERPRLASNRGRTLNAAIEEFQRLQMLAEFESDVYKTGLASLEKGRLEAARTLKSVSALQSPTRPQYPLQPRRLYNSFVFALAAFLLAGVLHLLAAIVRDHRD